MANSLTLRFTPNNIYHNLLGKDLTDVLLKYSLMLIVLFTLGLLIIILDYIIISILILGRNLRIAIVFTITLSQNLITKPFLTAGQ